MDKCVSHLLQVHSKELFLYLLVELFSLYYLLLLHLLKVMLKFVVLLVLEIPLNLLLMKLKFKEVKPLKCILIFQF